MRFEKGKSYRVYDMRGIDVLHYALVGCSASGDADAISAILAAIFCSSRQGPAPDPATDDSTNARDAEKILRMIEYYR